MHFELNMRRLKSFYLTARLGSLTAAAEQLFITQPAVSQQLKNLEEDCGAKLMNIKNKKVYLTETGIQLFYFSEKIFNEVEKAEQYITQSLNKTADTLRIGSTKTLVRYLLPGSITKFQERYPKVQIHLAEGSSEAMIKGVVEGRHDLAIVGRLRYPDSVTALPFSTDELLILAPPQHHLAQRGQISLKDLDGEIFILREKGSGTRWVIDRVFEGSGIVLRAGLETGNTDFIKELVIKNNALTALARMGVTVELANGNLVELKGLEETMLLYIDLVHRKDSSLTPLAQAFMEFVFGRLEQRGRTVPRNR